MYEKSGKPKNLKLNDYPVFNFSKTKEFFTFLSLKQFLCQFFISFAHGNGIPMISSEG